MWPMSGSDVCTAHDAALFFLINHTDACAAVMGCGGTAVAKLRQRVSRCLLLTPIERRRARSLFGAIRRMYSSTLRQHPSLPFDMNLLVRDASTGRRRGVDILIPRCRESVQPALRVLPASLRAAMRVRSRVIIYEHCSPAQRQFDLPSFDVRDDLLLIRRRSINDARPTQTMPDGAGAAFITDAAARALQDHSGDADASLQSVLLLPRGIAALTATKYDSQTHSLDPLPPSQPPALLRTLMRAGHARMLQRENALQLQDRMQLVLSEHWQRQYEPVEGWTRADGSAALTSDCIADALTRLGPRTPSQRPWLLTEEHSNMSLALIFDRETLSAAAKDAPDAMVRASRLVAQARRVVCSASLARMDECLGQGQRRDQGRDPDTDPDASRLGGEAPRRNWPHNVSKVGFCGVTNEGVEGDCTRGDRGSWNTRQHRVRSFADCIGRCHACTRCSFVSYSPQNDDCSWYSSSACNMKALGYDVAFRTVQVRPTARWDLGSTSGIDQQRIAEAHHAYTCGMRADRRWSRQLLKGALQMAVDALANGWPRQRATAATPRPKQLHGQAASVPIVDPRCVDDDFLLHNRQLLPPTTGGDALRSCTRAALVESSLPERPHAQLSHAAAAEALSARIEAIASRAAENGCIGNHTARMELHLSGFFSMIASVIKPWTAAIRMGRALLTPTAPGLLDRKDCPSVEMGCFFERIGPVACEPARMNLAHFRFNLAEQYREGLTDAHAIPADFRHLGSFWWVSQLTQRLLRPRRQLRTMLRLASRQSGLGAALASGRPVIGLHVRHGDACIRSETSRAARACDPLSAYMEAISDYASHLGATTFFLATDSESVLEEARTRFSSFTFLHTLNVARSSKTAPVTEILDEVIKRRARTGQGIAMTQHHALLGVVDALLLSRCHVLVGKFSSGLFRAAYALAAARNGGGLPPFISLDAPWCSDYAVPAGYNDEFPRRIPKTKLQEQIKPEGSDTTGVIRDVNMNVFLC